MEGFVVPEFDLIAPAYKAPVKRVRKALSLAQRIEVINESKGIPSVTYLAEKFQCGQTQIKNILRNRLHYQAIWARKQKSGTALNPYLKQMTAVGIILNEWIQRAKYYQININDDVLRSFSQEIADLINFKQFKPTNSWIAGFKMKHKISNPDINIKQEVDAQPESRKPLSLSTIIDDLRQLYGEAIIPISNGTENHIDGENYSATAVKEKQSFGNFITEAINTLQGNYYGTCESGDSVSTTRESFSTTRTSDDKLLKKIDCYREALNQLVPLEQFALLKENIRAVGLINQLENLFRDEMNEEINLFES